MLRRCVRYWWRSSRILVLGAGTAARVQRGQPEENTNLPYTVARRGLETAESMQKSGSVLPREGMQSPKPPASVAPVMARQ